MSNSNTQVTSGGRKVFVPSKQQRRLEESEITATESPTATPFGNSLGGILAAAYDEAGVEAPASPTETRTVKRSLDKRAVQWENPLFGALEIEMGGQLELGEVVAKGPNMCSQVYVFSKPSFIWLNLAVWAAHGVRILHAKAGEVTEVFGAGVPTLKVPVKWNYEKHLPHTRERDMDNVDIVFLNKEGMFVQLQVSLVTRKRRFWVQIQEIYAGQIVRTNHVKAKELNVRYHPVGSHVGLVVPLYGENAYPTADYIKSNPRMSGPVIERAIAWGAVVPMGDAVVAKWQPQFELPQAMSDAGFTAAVVQWFNLVLGYGFVITPNGRSYHAHFDVIVDANGNKLVENGDNPMPEPMKAIAIKYEDGPKPKATAIRVL